MKLLWMCYISNGSKIKLAEIDSLKSSSKFLFLKAVWQGLSGLQDTMILQWLAHAKCSVNGGHDENVPTESRLSYYAPDGGEKKQQMAWDCHVHARDMKCNDSWS